MKTSRVRLITISPCPVVPVWMSTGVCVHRGKVFCRNSGALHGTGWRMPSWQRCHCHSDTVLEQWRMVTLPGCKGVWHLVCQHQLIKGYPTPKCPRTVENYVHSKPYTRPTPQSHFPGSSNAAVSWGPVRIPVKGLQTHGAVLSCEPSRAEQAASPAPRQVWHLQLQLPAQGLHVSTGRGGTATATSPLMRCGEKMQPAGRLARLQGGKREKVEVERLSSHRGRKRRHLCMLSG